MKKKIFPLLLFFVASHVAHPVSADDVDPVVMDTQETPADTYVPLIENYPSFMVEPLGMDYVYNLGSEQPKPFDKVKKIDWYSLLRGNVAFLYAIRINQSRFALCLGGGLSTLYYAFALENKDSKMTCPTLERESESQTIDKYLENDAGKKFTYSAFKISFIDALLRLRFNSVLDDPKAGFHAWLGLKFGIRRSAFTMVDYKEYRATGSLKCKGDFNLAPCSFGVQAAVGYHRFGLVGGFHLSPLFTKNQGPPHSDLLRPFSFGIYIDLI